MIKLDENHLRKLNYKRKMKSRFASITSGKGDETHTHAYKLKWCQNIDIEMCTHRHTHRERESSI